MYFVKTPYCIKSIFTSVTWQKNTTHKDIYLTFDDGPHPQATPFVLDCLQRFNAKATFFCLGKNVLAYVDIYNQILSKGHSVGNHTNNHYNGFKTNSKLYVENILKAKQYINSNLFRPPYGRITPFQIKLIKKAGFDVIMWTVLSGDFDTKITGETCAKNVLLNSNNGSIIVFHDSQKAMPRLQVALPLVLQHFSKLGYTFKAL